MNPAKILTDYANRFENKYPKYTGKFFTNLDDWKNELAYLHGVEIFCRRLESAILNGEKICIYSDYDTDAVTATAVMYWGLIYLGVKKEKLTFYAPDRFTEGYGMNEQAAIDLAKDNDLIITVDCGVNSIKEAEHIKKAGKDLIITDHHQITGELPICQAVINPQVHKTFGTVSDFGKYLEKRSGQKPDYKNWDFIKNKSIDQFLTTSATGVGVAWFCVLWLAYYLSQKNPDIDMREINSLLPFVAIGTIADCQSIIEPTNRLMVKAGLKIFNNGSSKIAGLNELIEQIGLADKISQGYQITSQDMAFLFSPILNSSGRLSHARLSIQSMLADSDSQAKKLINELIDTNNRRKQDVKDILSEVETEAKNQFENNESIIWLEGPWSKGIIGLLASRLVNKYNLPVVVVGLKSDGEATASLRAPEGYNFPDAFALSPDLFTKGGGHSQAAGFSASPENLPQIKSSLSQSLPKQIKNNKKSTKTYLPEGFDIPKQLETVAAKKDYIFLGSNQLNKNLFESVWSMDPFGIDFPFPEFVFKVDSTNFRWLGEGQKHIKFFLENGVELVIFNIELEKKDLLQEFLDNEGVQLWVSSKVSKNSWNGQTKNDLIAQNIWLIN